MASAQSDLEKLRRQRAALAEFGRHALTSDDLDALLREACELISEALEVELVKVLERLPDGRSMLVRAGVNWRPGVVGHATLGADSHSPAGYALETGKPVISPDLRRETRFEIPDVLLEHGVESMINVVIRGEQPAWGVLEVDAPQSRAFSQDEVAFLQNYANIIAFAIERLDRQRELTNAMEWSRLLARELQHRVRNLLANVHSLADRTAANSPGLDVFREAFAQRIAALARTQDLLTRDIGGAVELRQILLQELEAHGAPPGERVAVTGPPVTLPAKAAQAIAMGFHELATNAVKHGALGQEGGRLEIGWERTDNTVTIRWRERTPIVEAPAREGFGREMLDRGLPFMLGGESSVELHPDGLEYRLEFPLAGEF